MEPHSELSVSIDQYKPSFSLSAKDYFQKAYDFCIKFHTKELADMVGTDFSFINEDWFFREYTWVVYASGFSAKVVSKLIPKLLNEYGLYAKLAVEPFDVVWERIRPICKNKTKATAIHAMAILMNTEVNKIGWQQFKEDRLSTPEKLAKLPYIGKVTCFHLARNLGLLEFVKPDLHLVRMAKHWGYTNPVEMCKDVRPDEMPLGIVDLILWYAASTFGTTELK